MKHLLPALAIAVILSACGKPTATHRLLPADDNYTFAAEIPKPHATLTSAEQSAVDGLQAFAIRVAKAVTDDPEFKARASAPVWYAFPPTDPNKDKYAVVVDFLLEEKLKIKAMNAAEYALQPDWSDFNRRVEQETPWSASISATYPADPKTGCYFVLTLREKAGPR